MMFVAGAAAFQGSAASAAAAENRAAAAIGGNYFNSDYNSASEVSVEGKKISEEITAEGVVLLKNEDNALPLKKGDKISLFGKSFGADLGGVAAAATDAGLENNWALSNFYWDSSLSGEGAPAHPGNGAIVSGLPTGESDISRFPDLGNSLAVYNDAAIVCFARNLGEGCDYPRTMGQVNGDIKTYGPDMQPVDGARAADDHSLQLDARETALLKFCAERFDKIIVLIKSSAPMELGFLDDPDHYAYSDKIKAAMWVGIYPSAQTLVSLLTGEINPSGHLTMTYARDFKADPTWNNFGDNFMEDYSDGNGGTVHAKGDQYENLWGGTRSGGGYYSNYVYYKEGIYSGYRYWETRGYTEGDAAWTGEPTDTLTRYAHGPDEAIHYYSKLTSDADKQTALDSKQWNNWYDAHVVYPFGHGLSYTDFAWEIAGNSLVGTLNADGNVTVDVKVTNMGAAAGKDTVQLYYSAPYIDGEIEKSQVVLGAFEKTKLLAPGESQTVTLTMAARDMASYDYSDANHNDFKGYELEAGDYTVYIGRDSHCWADENVLSLTYTVGSDAQFKSDAVTGNTVENRFDKVSEQLTHEDRYPEDAANNEKDGYMTRMDWSGTWPSLSYRLTAEQWIVDTLSEYFEGTDTPITPVWPEDKPADPWYTEEMPQQAVSRDPDGSYVQLAELYGLAYDDPLWDTFLNQLTVDELKELTLSGNYKSGADIPELGITKEINEDGPTAVRIPGVAGTRYELVMPFGAVVGATWNEELCYRYGKIMAEWSLWGGGNPDNRVAGWYAPAININRSPFGGRSGEYYSEDGVVAGKLSAQVVIGSQEKGMFCYVKHFALNNQETSRSSLNTWVDEQTMREVYFKPFEICVKEGKPLGIMSATNRIGARWASACYELITGVLRDEWGFRGNVVTDAIGAPYGNADLMIRAGGSLVLGSLSLHVNPDSATTIACLRNSAHDVLYSHANSMAVNTGDTPTVPRKISSFVTKSLNTGVKDIEYSDNLQDCVELNTAFYPDLGYEDLAFTLKAPDALPEGLTLSSDGTISGTPVAASRTKLTVAVSCGNETLEQKFTLNIAGDGGAVIYQAKNENISSSINSPMMADLGGAEIYAPYATPEDAANFPDIVYTLANGSRLPEGLTLSPDGKLYGTPVKECRDYRFTVNASALGYGYSEFEFSISVLYPLGYDSSALADASYGTSYVASVGNAKCDAAVTYALKTDSRLPAGLQLTAGGYIVGVPQEAGIYKFTVVASSPYAQATEAEYTL